MKTIVTLALIGLTISGCARSNIGPSSEIHRDTKTLSAAAVLASGDPASVKAENLAVIGETLFNNGAFDQASTVLDAALTLDATNLRAGLLTAITKPIITSRGLMLRIAPLLQRTVANPRIPYSTTSGYEAKMNAQLRAKSGFEAIFWDAPALNLQRSNYARETLIGVSAKVMAEDSKTPGYAIVTEVDLQNALDQIYEAFDSLRVFAKAHKDSSITITASTLLIPDIIERYADACEVTESDTLVYELKCPPDSERNHVMLNGADFQLMVDIGAYYETMIALATAYDARGLALDPGPTQSSQAAGVSYMQEKVEALLKEPKFGLARANSKMAKLSELGLDMVGGLNWAIANRKELCPSGTGSGRNRPGMLFNQGFCTAGLEYFFDVISVAGSGKSVKLKVGTDKLVEFAPYAFFKSAPSDLRKLGPFKFGACDTLVSIGEQTLAGVFPNGDADYVLKTAAGPGCQ